MLLIKGPCVHLLADRLTHSQHQHWGSCSKGARDVHGKSELSGFRTNAARAAFSWKEGLLEAIISLLHPPPCCVQTQAAMATTSDSLSTWLTLFVCLALVILRPCLNLLSSTPMPYPVAFLYKWLALANAAELSKVSPRFTKLKQAASSFGMSYTSG